MKVDWQAYLDKSLSREETDRAERLLKTDPLARSELDALVSFQAALRSAGMCEPVPIASLESSLSAIVNQRPVVKGWRLAVAACVAIVAIVFAMSRIGSVPRVVDAPTSPEMALETTDLHRAYEWAYANSGVDAPVLALADTARFNFVHCGKDWVCYDYEYLGKTIHVYVFKSNTRPSGCTTVKREEGDLFIANNGATAAFLTMGLTYRFSGGTKEECVRLAEVAMKELGGYSL